MKIPASTLEDSFGSWLPQYQFDSGISKDISPCDKLTLADLYLYSIIGEYADTQAPESITQNDEKHLNLTVGKPRNV